MIKVHVGRQPIFKAHSVLYGYELLFRDGSANAFPDIDGDTATSQLLHHSFFAFDFDQLTGGTYGFVNFTQELLVKRVPRMFPPERLIVEIIETVQPTEAVLEACRELTSAGYRLVLDDFVLGKGMDAFIEHATMIKLDLRVTRPPEIAETIRAIGLGGPAFLAEKVETHDELRAASDAGCSYFQGYWFSRPEVLSARDVRPQQTTLLQLIYEVNRPDLELDALERLVSQDVSITYKLLRYINSAFFQRPRRVESVRQAIIYLGLREIRQLVSLVATAKLSADKPEELVRLSIVRARACDAIGRLRRGPATAGEHDELFLLGLLSAIDAIMDRSMDAIVRELPLSPALESALVSRQGPLADCLELVIAHEQGRWSDFAERAERLGIDDDAYPAIHLEAVAWARSFMQLPD